MSYVEISQEYNSSKLALGMLSDAPLETVLNDYPNIRTIVFCLDNDEPGRKATEELMLKYSSKGYMVKDMPAPQKYKDYNEWLVSLRRQRNLSVTPKSDVKIL